MDKNRSWVIGSVMVMVVVVALGWLFGIQPQLAATAAADEQRATVAETNASQEASLAKLKKDFGSIDALRSELASLSKSVPSGTDVPDYVNQLDALASATQVTITGLTVADASSYTPVAPAVVPAASGDAAAPATAPATPAPATVEAPGAPPVTNSLITADNFASLPVSISVTGPYGNVLNFVNGLQTGTRLFLVTGLATTAMEEAAAANDATAAQPANTAGMVDGTITGLIYSIVIPAKTEVGAG